MLKFNEEKHEYTYNGKVIPSVTTVINKVLYDDFMFAKYKDKAKIGTAVHKVCELYDKNILDEGSLNNVLMPYYMSYKRFLRDFETSILINENRFYNEKYGYCGTIDRIVYSKKLNTLDLIDIKTGAKTERTKFQLNAYFFGIKEKQRIIEIQKEYNLTINLKALHLKDDGTYQIVSYEQDLDCHRLFLNALQVYKFRNNLC
jgi:hypothetical protein